MFILILSKALNLNYRSLRRGGNLYRDILGYLRELAYLEEQRGFHNSHIALYHAGMASKDQDYILHEFSKPESVIRLVICTIAFGLGISIPDTGELVALLWIIGRRLEGRDEMEGKQKPFIVWRLVHCCKPLMKWRSYAKRWISPRLSASGNLF